MRDIKAQLDLSLAIAETHNDRDTDWVLPVDTGHTSLFTTQLRWHHYLQQERQVFTALDNRYYMARAADWLGAAYGDKRTVRRTGEGFPPAKP